MLGIGRRGFVAALHNRGSYLAAGVVLLAGICAAGLIAAQPGAPPIRAQGGALVGAATSGCEVSDVTHEGLPATRMANRWVELVFVPKLGGRLMQVKFQGHAYLFENPKLKGQYFPPLAPGAPSRWYNYGGDKIWPMPEGTEDTQHWPGPLADVLDDGDYQLTVVSRGPRCMVRMEGPADQRTGLQYMREIALGSDSPEISFHAVMKNASTQPIEWSVQTVTQYDTADASKPGDYNHDFWAFTPANPKSAYLDGFHVRSGLADDPSFSLTGGLFRLHWLYLQNEVWVDSPGDWVAVVEHEAGYAMVERFHYQPDAEYPGKASVIFYKNGPAVQMNEQGLPEIRVNADDAPYYMEAELNSPMAKLAPGQTYAMDTQWCPALATKQFAGVAEAGVVGEPLTAVRTPIGVLLSGSFGVFFPGRLTAHFAGANGADLGSQPLGNARPDEILNLSQEVKPPSGTVRVTVSVAGEGGKNRGELGEAAVTRKS
jgi:hypothetical protein